MQRAESAALDADVAHVKHSRKLTFRHGFAILVSIQIGSGIFSSPAQVDSNVPSPAAALGIWGLSGLLSWAGAASFAELGTVIPKSGGMQEHLRYVYGDGLSAVMAWTWILVAKPSSIAIQGIVLGESIGAAIGYPNNPAFTTAHVQGIALLALLFVFVLNLQSTTAPARASEVFTAVKFITVGGISFGGLAVLLYHYLGQKQCHGSDWCSRSWLEYHDIASGDSNINWSEISWWQLSGHLSAALYAGLWAYSGWDNVAFIAGDVRDVGTSLPRIVHSAMAVVMLSLQVVNVSYYVLLPWQEISISHAVAVVVARAWLGFIGAAVVCVLISISCMGVMNSQMFVSGRLIRSAAQRGYLPAIFSRTGAVDLLSFVHRHASRLWRSTERQYTAVPTGEELATLRLSSLAENFSESNKITGDVPILALALNVAFAAFYVIIGDFPFLVTFVGMAEWSFLFLDVLGLIILRWREPELARPYRVNLIIPITFCIVVIFVVAASSVHAPIQSFVLLALTLFNIVVYRFKAHTFHH